jgi:hypothetical protein
VIKIEDNEDSLQSQLPVESQESRINSDEPTSQQTVSTDDGEIIVKMEEESETEEEEDEEEAGPEIITD